MSENDFNDLLKRHFPKATVVDDVESTFILNGYIPQKAIQKGIYLFVDGMKGPDVVFSGFNDKFYLIARAICIIEIKGEYLAHIAEFNVTSLISSLSTFGKLKASKLYGIPSDPDDQKEWNDLKEKYVANKIIGKIIKVEHAHAPNAVTWRFGDNEDIDVLKNTLRISDKLSEFLGEKELYHVLKPCLNCL